jgi:hypothetical protein
MVALSVDVCLVAVGFADLDSGAKADSLLLEAFECSREEFGSEPAALLSAKVEELVQVFAALRSRAELHRHL